MIEAVRLCKSFGSVQAARDVSFVVKKGEAVGFLGPNGAGKTTTFRMIAGTIGPTSGQVRLFGKDLSCDPIGAKRKLGYMPENAPLYPELTTREYLLYRAELKGISRASRKQSVENAAAQTRLAEVLGTQIGKLSKGYRQRVALADALLGDPPILLLDEPTAGLDPNQVLEVRELIVSLAKERAILLSTHVLSEVEATCSRALILNQGQVVAEGAIADLKRERAGNQSRILSRGSADTARLALAPLNSGTFEVTEKKKSDELEIIVSGSGETALSDAVKALCASDFPILEAGSIRAALDEVFAQLTSKKGRS